MLKSYLLLFTVIYSYINEFCLDNKCYTIFILYLFIYLLEFIVIYNFIEVECIYSNYVSIVFSRNVLIAIYIYLFLFIGLDLIFFYSIHAL